MIEWLSETFSSLTSKDWIELALSLLGIFVAVLATTYFASKQHRKSLVQNLNIETYKEIWFAVQAVNTAATTFASLANLKLNFLANKIHSSPMVGEKDHDFDFRRRGLIQDYRDERHGMLSEIAGAFIQLHRLWEQHAPIVHKLDPAFVAYKKFYDDLSKRTVFPSKELQDIDIDNFDHIKTEIEEENGKLANDHLQLMVLGMDLARMFQEETIAKYYPTYKSIPRSVNATEGLELTREGIVPVKKTSDG